METHVLTKIIQKCPNHTYKLLTGHLKLKQIAMRGSQGLNGGAEDLLLFVTIKIFQKFLNRNFCTKNVAKKCCQEFEKNQMLLCKCRNKSRN